MARVDKLNNNNYTLTMTDSEFRLVRALVSRVAGTGRTRGIADGLDDAIRYAADLDWDLGNVMGVIVATNRAAEDLEDGGVEVYAQMAYLEIKMIWLAGELGLTGYP